MKFNDKWTNLLNQKTSTNLRSINIFLVLVIDSAIPSQDTQLKETRSIINPPPSHPLVDGMLIPSQDTQNKVTRSINTPPWMGC